MKITTFVPKQGCTCMRTGAVYGNDQMVDLSAAYSLYLQDKIGAPYQRSGGCFAAE